MDALLAGLSRHLLGNVAIETLVGQRVYEAGSVPQNTKYPYLTYQLLTGAGDLHQGGADGTASSLVQVDGWVRGGTAADDRRTLTKALNIALNGYRGHMGEAWVQSVRATFNHTTETAVDARGDERLLRVRADLTIRHNVTVPA